jgi:predicted RNase H-like HicB family nuclease
MKKLLAIVERKDGGFRGYVPRLPGCEVRAATAEQAEADIQIAARAHLAANKEGTNGIRPDDVELIAAIEAPPPPRPRDDGMDDVYDRLHRDFKPEDLEFFLHLDEQKWITFEELMAGLGLDATEPATDETLQ